ncbi:NEDD4-binding protein 2-like 2 isoform X2 [Sarcophilus harrisii]|uniref:NEDD4 binding protein 2 like 2 n=1 Tax=Sarcophilus harrisii TaxID=9305 RepID=A0A7N4PVE5_SARHA|nr:NEDD4-binding protein 2-like 2 isoform X2 [Sarcophilus harrisii]
MNINEIPRNNYTYVSGNSKEIRMERNHKVAIPVSGEEVEYSTSKAFIGPIYKSPEENERDERKHHTEKVTGGLENKQNPSNKLDIDNELSQFYKEIQELESEKEDLEGNCQEFKPQEQFSLYYQGHSNDNLKSDEEKEDTWFSTIHSLPGDEQYFSNEPVGWNTEYAVNGQMEPMFFNNPIPTFRPEWQPVESSLVPHGLFPSGFNYHLNVQRFNPSPSPPPNVFHGQDVKLCEMYNGYNVTSVNTNWNCPTFDQTNRYSDCDGRNSSIQPFRNGRNEQDGQESNGFYETREESWEDPSLFQMEKTDRLMNQQFQEEKLKRLLILLRGLPGSGKTTLSRVLLGQNRGGIVFSTDDYFRHRNGYSYNVRQLGDAHDWNQSRAKKAIDQGRSPVIIDNTNTQAWEMKPYVEMAIGKGYRVEFHEPETWWKFDPEELEKRNKHGVSREKIAQMLDHYEYKMSISIVMNSVEPPHRRSERLRRQREEKLKKPSRASQRRNRRRNRKLKNSNAKSMKKESYGTLSYPVPEDEGTSESEEHYSEEENNGNLVSMSIGDLGCTSADSVNRHSKEGSKSIKFELGKENISNAQSVTSVTWENPPTCDSTAESNNLYQLSLTSIPHENALGHMYNHQTTVQNFIEKQNNSYVPGIRCSEVKADSHVEPSHSVVFGIKDRIVSAKATCVLTEEDSMSAEKLSDKEMLPNQCRFNSSYENLKYGHRANRNQTNCWAFFSATLSDEKLEWDLDTQPSFTGWPEGPHNFINPQRQKKSRCSRQTCPDGPRELIRLVYTDKGTDPGNHLQALMEENADALRNEELASSPNKLIDLIPFMETETNVLRSNLPEICVQRKTSAIITKKGRPRRIFNLAPNFHLPRQAVVSVEEKRDALITDSQTFKNILVVENDRSPEVNHEEKNKPEDMTVQCNLSLGYPIDLPSNSGGELQSHDVSFSQLRKSLCLPKRAVLKFLFTSEKRILMFKSQTVGNRLNEVELISSEISNHKPKILLPAKISSEHPSFGFDVFSGSFGAKVHKEKESKSSQCVQTKYNQDSLRIMPNSFGLPLSQRFAFQLVNLFGSPGVPIESLLLDDYVVSLDWKTLKMIYLQWKTSVEIQKSLMRFQWSSIVIQDVIDPFILSGNFTDGYGYTG